MEWVEFERKLDKWRERSKASWWLRSSSEPLAFRLLWKFKIQVRPPYFANPIQLALGLGFSWGAFMFMFYFFGSQVTHVASSDVIKRFPIFVAGGAAFGILTALWVYVEARVRKLPRWEDL